VAQTEQSNDGQSMTEMLGVSGSAKDAGCLQSSSKGLNT
jgi:phosphoenolpyruvate carboxylase